MPFFSSKLMIGKIKHRRFSPAPHELSYPIFMPLIDLDELEQLASSIFLFGFRGWHWARFRREDYLGDGDLKQAVIDQVNQLTGQHLDAARGKVMALINLRYLGLYFSPVNFYYIYDDQGNWLYLLAEVTNTPWNEKHCYVLNTHGDDAGNMKHPKAFHVSPFNSMHQQYCWTVKPVSDSLRLHLACIDEAKGKDERTGCDTIDDSDTMKRFDGTKVFDATLTMKAHVLSNALLFRLLLKTPVVALKVLWGIYWHAFKLWRKGVPIYDHPKNNI